MQEDDRLHEIKQLISNHTKSPSVRHIRDPYAIITLANEILRIADHRKSAWLKWSSQRENLVKNALGCWIPVDDLNEFLNRMPGPILTVTDVDQRMRAFEEEEYYSYPKEELKEGCLAIYEREKAEGTEMPAIVGRLRDHLESEEQRLWNEQRERHAQWREKDRIAREQRLLSGADCTWTQLVKSPLFHCRVNGRLYRLTPTKDKMWHLHRVDAIDGPTGLQIGKYSKRGEATKVVAQVAYQPEQF